MSDLSTKIISSLLEEQRKTRRWRNIRFFIMVIIVMIIITMIYFSSNKNYTALKDGPHASLVELNGPVAANESFSAKKIVPLLEEAFADKSAKAVVLDINSPGGSPVQAQIIYDQIMQLKRIYHKPVIAVGEDAMASAAYLVASAADKIYVSPETISGSIGVLMSGFGFTDLMKKIGLKRRLFTAGKNKVINDPFSPLLQRNIKKIHDILETSHQEFIADVKKGRGQRLHGKDSILFSGSFWLGKKAVKLGLVDGIGNIYSIKRALHIKHYEVYRPQKSLLQRLAGQTAVDALEHFVLNDTNQVSLRSHL